MANRLYTDIDSMCMALKHGAESVDPNAIRSLLRRAQAAIEILDGFSFLEGLNVEAKDVDGYREYHVKINAVLTREQTENTLLYISGHWDSDCDY